MKLNLKRNIKKHTNNIPEGNYRIMVIDFALNIEDDDETLVFHCKYSLYNTSDCTTCTVEQSFVNDINDPDCINFFDFIETNNITYEEYEELNGLVFDAKVRSYDVDRKNVIVFSNKKLVAHPVPANYK